MGYIVELPPGRWRTAEDEEQWRSILEWHDDIGVPYRQMMYLAMTDPKFAARMANEAYRARFEREHMEGCDQLVAAARWHVEQNYVPDGGDWGDFEFCWVPDDQDR